MKRLVAFLGLLAGFACALAFACKSSQVDVDAGEVLEAGIRGGPIVGSNPGQPFGPCPVGSDCYGSNWQQERTLFLQQIAMALDAAAGPGSGIFLNDAGVLTLAVPYQPALDGGFPAASTGQFFVQLSIGPGAATITGDLHCSTATPGLCTLTAIQGVPVDGSGGAAGYVLTWVDGGWSPQPAAVASYGLDLAVNPDGGSGQVLVGITGNDGGAALPEHTQGWAVDNLQPVWGVTVAAPADAATAPAAIVLNPGPPNAAAATTAGGTPGPVKAIAHAPLSSGTWSGLQVAYDADGGGATVAQLGPVDNSQNGFLHLGLNGNAATNANYTLYCDKLGRTCEFETRNGTSAHLIFGAGASTLFSATDGPGTNNGNFEIFQPRLQFYAIQGGAPVAVIFNTQVGDIATQAAQVIGQSAYASAVTHTSAGPAKVCGGNAVGAGAIGYTSLGAGYTGAVGSEVCNQTIRVDDKGATFLAPASLPGIPAQGSNGAGELVADGPGATGGANWLASGGYITEFAPGGNGNAFGSPFTTTANVIGGHTTAVGNFVTMQVPIPTGQSAAITLTVDGRVTVAGATSVVGDSVSLATFAAVTNPSGTPRPLGNTGTDQSWTSYDTSQTAEVTAIAASTSPGFFNIVVTQAGAPNVGATILWTMAYQARLY